MSRTVSLPVLALALAVTLGAGVAAGYLWRGGATPAAAPAAGAPAPMAAAQPGAHPTTPDQMERMVQDLAARLERQPDDADGWAMLARSLAVGGRHEKALPAFRRAQALRPNDAVLLADMADTVAVTQGRKLEGEPEQLVKRALEIDPDQLKALSLAGTLAFDRGDFKTALAHWQRMQQLAPESPLTRQVAGSIDEARARLGGAPVMAGSGGAPVVASAGGSAGPAPDRLFILTPPPAASRPGR